MPIEKYTTLKPAPGQGKRTIKAKLLTALGATGVLRPYTDNPERIIERKILLQNTFSPSTGGGGGGTSGLLTGLSAYWKLDTQSSNVTPDATANGLDLTFSGTGPINFGATGLINNAFSPNSTNDVISHADTALLAAGAGVQFTFQVWIKFSDHTFDYVFGGKWDTSNAALKDFCFYNDAAGSGGHYNFYAADSGGAVTFVTSTIATANGVWNHVCGGFDGTNIWIQVDGETRVTLAQSGVRRTAVPFTIANSNNLFRATPASIDECAFWQRSLSSSDIATLYNAGAGFPYSSFS
jgi:hypothetical protein